MLYSIANTAASASTKATRERGVKITLGLDLGDKYSFFCLLRADGEILEEGRVRTTPAGLREFFGRLPTTWVALETGTHSPWVSRLVRRCGHEVIVANARQLRLISENQRKCDRLDATLLARLARVDPELLKPVKHRGVRAQQALAALRARDSLVAARTKLINHVRGAVKSFGARLTGCSTPAFHTKAPEQIPAELREAMKPVLESIKLLSAKIKAFDKTIEQAAKCGEFPAAERLQQVSGVGALTAMCFLLVIDDPRRFERSRTVGAYVGLTPKRSESGEQQPQLGITKSGDRMLRRLLVGSAQYILGPFGPDTDLRRYGERLAQRGGKNAKKRAAVAVARKLAVLLHRLWLSGEEYDPLRNSGPPRPRPRGSGRMVTTRSRGQE